MKPTPIVVLDANILIRDLWHEGRQFSLLNSHLYLGHIPVITDIALREAVAFVERRVNETRALWEKDSSRRAKILATFQRIAKGFDIETSETRHILLAYEKHVRDHVARHHGFIAECPNVPIGVITQRSLAATKPFTNGDKGFRDTLIWLTVLDLIEKGHHFVCMVTENVHDFSDGYGALHPSLETEAKSRMPRPFSVHFYPSLDAFLLAFDDDGEFVTQALKSQLVQEKLQGLNLRAWLDENLVDLLEDAGGEFDGVRWTGFPYEAEAPRLHDLEEIRGIDIISCELVRPGVVRLFVGVSIVGVFSCDIFFEEPDVAVMPSQIAWRSDPAFEWSTTFGMQGAATFMVRIDYDLSNSSVLSAEVAPIQHDYKGAIEDLEDSLRDDETDAGVADQADEETKAV